MGRHKNNEFRLNKCWERINLWIIEVARGHPVTREVDLMLILAVNLDQSGHQSVQVKISEFHTNNDGTINDCWVTEIIQYNKNELKIWCYKKKRFRRGLIYGLWMIYSNSNEGLLDYTLTSIRNKQKINTNRQRNKRMSYFFVKLDNLY